VIRSVVLQLRVLRLLFRLLLLLLLLLHKYFWSHSQQLQTFVSHGNGNFSR
jgi:hypothetical protein